MAEIFLCSILFVFSLHWLKRKPFSRLTNWLKPWTGIINARSHQIQCFIQFLEFLEKKVNSFTFLMICKQCMETINYKRQISSGREVGGPNTNQELKWSAKWYNFGKCAASQVWNTILSFDRHSQCFAFCHFPSEGKMCSMLCSKQGTTNTLSRLCPHSCKGPAQVWQDLCIARRSTVSNFRGNWFIILSFITIF